MEPSAPPLPEADPGSPKDNSASKLEPCNICLNLGIKPKNPEEDHIRRHLKACRIAEIQESAADGCSSCAILEAGLTAVLSETTSLDPTKFVHIIFHLGMPLRIESSDFDIEFFMPVTQANADKPQYNGTEKSSSSLWTDTANTWPYVGKANVVVGILDAKAAAVLSHSWLNRCRTEHPICQRLLTTRLQGGPSRLIHLLPDGNLRLVQTDGVTAPYIALSYCWGVGDNCPTTRKTLSERMEFIDYRLLPKTVRDAVDITRHMGVNYIWIDSICIIQDDKDGLDWRIESSNMGAIYEGALLTISATRSPSVDVGFLGLRHQPVVKTNEETKGVSPGLACLRSIRCEGPDGSPAKVFVRLRLPHDAIIPEDADSTRYPLLARGWTFQERLLSTRTLHFLPQEVVWECRCDFWCECMGSEADQVWKDGNMRGSSYNREISQPDLMNSTLVWQSLVQQYSRRVLTVQSDRLPALSGIATRFLQADATMGSYLAGMWEKDILWHLLWQVDHEQLQRSTSRAVSSQLTEESQSILSSIFAGTASRGLALLETVGLFSRPEKNSLDVSPEKSSLRGTFSDISPDERRPRQPTWSWISTPWPVMWPTASIDIMTRCEPSAKFLTCRCTYDLINPFGDVTGGELELEAAVRSAVLGSYHDDCWTLGQSYQSTPKTWGRGSIFIPDGTFDELKLSPGDTIYYAKVLRYTKGAEKVWVALGLRRLGVVFKETESQGKGSETSSRSELHDLLATRISESTSISESRKMKIIDNRRPTDHVDFGGQASEPLERYYRVGLVKGKGPIPSFELGSEETRRIIII